MATMVMDRSPYTAEELEEFRALILEKREEAQQEIEMMKGVLDELIEAEAAESSANAHHMADIASDEESIQLYYRLIHRTRNYLRQLDRALMRIENGTYGICRATGQKIPKGRLMAVPHTRYAIQAKAKGLDRVA